MVGLERIVVTDSAGGKGFGDVMLQTVQGVKGLVGRDMMLQFKREMCWWGET